MCAISNEHNDVVEYLATSRQKLESFHPNWTQNVRNKATICIPATHDLCCKYSGALDCNADGYNEIRHTGDGQHSGDLAERRFLDVIQSLLVGGILVGNINKQHMGVETFRTMPYLMKRAIRKARSFEFDYIFCHPPRGIYAIEVKCSSQKSSLMKAVTKARKQLKSFWRLFEAFCEFMALPDSKGLFRKYYRHGVIYTVLTGDDAIPSFLNEDSYVVITSDEQLSMWLTTEFANDKNLSACNFAEDSIFLDFVAFLAGYRPDFFMSSVQCALRERRSLLSHAFGSFEYKRGFYNVNVVHNNAKPITVFLNERKSKKLNYAAFVRLYLTKEQMLAIDSVDRFGVRHSRQLILGPPGSGKSIILMLKLFIQGQDKERKTRPLLYHSNNKRHELLLTSFVQLNLPFQRTVSNNLKAFATGQVDAIIDEQAEAVNAVNFPKPTYDGDDQTVVVVCTGLNGNISQQYRNFETYKAKGLLITELRTIFRSSNHIQTFLRQFANPNRQLSHNNCIYSGHNFNGIPVELYTNLENEDLLKHALADRIERLLTIENCDPRCVGLFQPSKYKEPGHDVQVFSYFDRLQSLEFPIMIIVQPSADNIYTVGSRAVCHLIVYATDIVWHDLKQKFEICHPL